MKFKGQVIQVTEGESETQIRFNVNNDYDKTILCTIPNRLTNNNRILDNDKITISKISNGLYTYTSTFGANITLPLISVDIISK